MNSGMIPDGSKFKQRFCSVCGHAHVKLLFPQRFAWIEGASFLSGYDVVSCELCGFVYATNIPGQIAFDEYYYHANKYEHEIEQPDTFTGKYDSILEEIIELGTGKTASIVDIGCAKSEILRLLQNKGFSDLTGVDPSKKNIEYLRSKGISGIHATIDTMSVSKKYDMVLLVAVLEHVYDLHHTMEILYNITALGGMLMIVVPNMAEPLSNELPFQEFSREHINYFTAVSLSNLLTRYEFQAVALKEKNGVLLGTFRKKSKMIRKDSSGELCLLNYIELSKKYEDEIYANLLPYSEIPIIIWGAGTFAQRLLEKKLLNNIVAIVDSNPAYAGKKHGNIKIIAPNELKFHKNPVLIAASLRYVDAIIFEIRNELKLDNEIIKLHSDYSFHYSLDDYSYR